jgi:hypothetical protein
MNGLRIFGARFLSLFQRRRLDRERDEEIHFHLETLEQENIR